MGVWVALVFIGLPFVVRTLQPVLEDVNRELEEAAATLGANRWQRFTQVVLPLTQEGLIIGGTLVFTGCVTAYITPALLGGPKVLMLETLLTKQRILEIYLNHVEWGEGLFGAQAAARHYFGKDASRLAPMEAARLAVMLPAPKRFEKRPDSAYVASRAATIAARMRAVELP